MSRHAGVRIDLAAVARNVTEMAARAPEAEFCAVVKANGYGHGAVPVARAALSAGAAWLAVALVEEGAELRDAGITAPILLLSEPSLDSFDDAFDLRLTPTIYHRDGLAAAESAARTRGGRSARWAVHVKVDTGMHRVGLAPHELRDFAAHVLASECLLLGGVGTHLAVADDPGRPETTEQLELFEKMLRVLRDSGIDPGLVHVANSAGMITSGAAGGTLVRCGISLYGIAPSENLASQIELEPAMSVAAEVTHILSVPAGGGVSYGLAHRFDVDTAVAVLPLGYADGVPRSFGLNGGEVLIGGIRRPVRGVVTMDQMMVELGPVDDPGAVATERGDEAVLVGSQSVELTGAGSDRGSTVVRQGRTETVTAWEWANIMDTIPYEIVCGFSARLPREYSGVGSDHG